jgi:hypothetical protein
MPIDFNNAEPQREMGLIDDGTIAVVHMTIRPGSAGEGGWLKRSKGGDSQALDAEFTVVDGPFAKRKFWSLFTLEGTTEGHQKAADISASRLRAIIESAKGIKPDDQSDAAKAARTVSSWGEFDGLRFVAKIGVEKGKDNFKDKNILESAITPDRKAWIKVEQTMKAAAAVASIGATLAPAQQPTSGVQKPSWARGA